MKKTTSVFIVSAALGVAVAAPGHAESAPTTAPPMDVGDDVLEVLMLPVEVEEAVKSGMPEAEVGEAVQTFKAAGMSPGDAASVVRVERGLNLRRGERGGFGAFVMAEIAAGRTAAELARELREREATTPLDPARRKSLMQAIKARKKAEQERLKGNRKRIAEKRARGETVNIRGHMRAMNRSGGGDVLPAGPTLDVPWLEKRLGQVQRRMIRLDQAGANGQGKGLARAEGHAQQRARLLEERDLLVKFIERMKRLDADGQMEGSARDQLLDEIRGALKIDERGGQGARGPNRGEAGRALDPERGGGGPEGAVRRPGVAPGDAAAGPGRRPGGAPGDAAGERAMEEMKDPGGGGGPDGAHRGHEMHGAPAGARSNRPDLQPASAPANAGTDANGKKNGKQAGPASNGAKKPGKEVSK